MKKVFGLGLVLAALAFGNAGAQSSEGTAAGSGWGTVAQAPGAWGGIAQEESNSDISQDNQCLDPGTGAPASCGCTWIHYCHTPSGGICKYVNGACLISTVVCAKYGLEKDPSGNIVKVC